MKDITKVYTVEEIVDLGNHVLHITKTLDAAERIYEKYESERIRQLEANAAATGKELGIWQYAPRHQIGEYDVEE